jgi:hypothetical protein
MSFIVRQISNTADGRQIVRPTTYEQVEICVGRDSACEIHLPDLAVEMRHALIAARPGGQVHIEALGDMGFEADGRAVDRVTINAAVGGELSFGGHRLTVSKEGEDIVIAVERVASVADSTDEKDVNSLFKLDGVLTGRRVSAWVLIGLVLSAFLIWPIYSYATSQGVKKREAGFHADTMWSSGSLSIAHKSLENNCQACHVKEFETVKDETCMNCHKDDAHDHAKPERLAAAMGPKSFGGKIEGMFMASFGIPEGRCVECHTEHEGEGRMEPTAQQFCSDCHTNLKSRLPDTKLGGAGDFGLDHPQFQPLITAGIDGDKRLTKRVTLSGAISEDNGLKFPHDIHMSKSNGIARMAQTMKAEQGWGDSLACKDCHVRTPDGVSFKPTDMEEDCGMCHSLAFDQIGGTIRTLRHGEPSQVIADLRAFYRSTGPSRPINLSGMSRRRPGEYAAFETANDFAAGARAWPGQADEAIRAVFSRGGACYDCHVVTPTGSGWSVKKVVQPTRYMNKGWFNHDAHKQEDCQSCHKAETSKVATDLLLPDLKSCRTCHVGGTGESLVSVKEPVESTCAMCHDYHFDGMAPWQSKKQGNEKMKSSTTAAQKEQRDKASSLVYGTVRFSSK